MDDESLVNWNRQAMKVWDSFEPIRKFVKEYPEFKEPFIEAFGAYATGIFGSEFKGPKGEHNG